VCFSETLCCCECCVRWLTDVKQRRMLSPVSMPQYQSAASSVIVIEPPPSVIHGSINSAAEEMQSMLVESGNLTAPHSVDLTGIGEKSHLAVKPELIEQSAASSDMTENVSASMSELSLVSDEDTVPPVAEVGDAEIAQQNEITEATGKDPDASRVPSDASVDAQEVPRSLMHLAAAATEQTELQKVAKQSQHAEDQTSTYTGDVPSSQRSTYETDVAMYKREMKSSDADDKSACEKGAGSDSTSEAFTSCIAISPAGSDSVFHSPQSNISDNKNVSNNNNESPGVQLQQQRMQQHSSGDTAMTPSERKIVVYCRHDGSTAGETRKAGSECTQSMLTAPNQAAKDTADHLSENAVNVESEEPVGGGGKKGQGSKVADSAGNVKDSESSEDNVDDNNDDNEGKIDDTQDKQLTADEEMAAELQTDENEMGMFTEVKKKWKKNRGKKAKQPQSVGVAESGTSVKSTVKIEADDVESVSILRPPRMMRETSSIDRQTESEARGSAMVSAGSGRSDTNANDNKGNDTVSQQSSQDTAATSVELKRVLTASSSNTGGAKVRKRLFPV